MRRVVLRSAAAAAVTAAALVQPALAQIDPRYDGVFINEMYFDPPGNEGDITHEYIELRGTPGMSLDNHYLIFIENEQSGTTGIVETFFDLNGRTMGTNGYLTLRQKNTTSNQYTVAPGTTNLVNTGFGVGFGSSPAASSIGARDIGGEGIIENSGFTAMLIRNDGNPTTGAPALNQDLDAGDNGLDHPSGTANWIVLDAIGIHSEFGEANGRLYAPINFGPEASTNIEPDATYVGVGYEIEYIARWGTSDDQTAGDWHISNLTDRTVAGFTGDGDFRQSGEPHPDTLGGPLPPDFDLESNQAVPYGTNLTNSMGRPNYPIPDGDLNQDEFVGQDDLDVPLQFWGQYKPQQAGYWLGGDPTGDGFVGQDDLDFVLANWGQSGGVSPAVSSFSTMAVRSAHAVTQALSSNGPHASFVAVDNSAALSGHVTSDLQFTTDTDWLSAQILIELAEGSFYQSPFNGDSAPPTDAIVNLVAAAAFDTYVKGADAGEAAAIAGGAVDLGGTDSARFLAQLIDVAWSTSDTDDIGILTLARFTLTDDATGTFTFRITSIGQDPVLVTGQIVNGVFVVPEPASIVLATLGAIALVGRRRRRA